MANATKLVDDLLQHIEPDSKALIFGLPEDLIRFICVHCEYTDIVFGIHVSCKSLHEITSNILNSNYYIYRLHILSTQLNEASDQVPLKIVQVKYFNEYKYLLSSSEFNKLENNKDKASYDPTERCKISLRSSFSNYLSAEPSGLMLCDRPQCKEWECFTSIPLSQNKIALRTHHNTFVSVQADGSLQCNSDKLLQRETLTVHPQENGTFAFKSCDNKFISSQPNGSIEANRDKALKWESFNISIIDDLHYNNDVTAFDQRIPTSHILLRYNQFYDTMNHNAHFKNWLRKSWNNGNMFSVACHSVKLFAQFMYRMDPRKDGEEKENVEFHPESMLSLKSTVQLLRLTNRAAPQPNNDQNRLCNALSLVRKYNNLQYDTKDRMQHVYGLDIGFHIGDSTKQSYLQKHFIPNLSVLHSLRFIILHGCHKERIPEKKKNEESCIDLFYDTLKELKNIIYMDLSCFCSKLKRMRNVHHDEKENDSAVYPVIFPTSVECINFGFAFEILADNKMKIANIDALDKLKLIYIELNPKINKMPIQFISQFMLAPSLDTVAINLAGLVWQNLRYDATKYLENIAKYWKINKQSRLTELNVVVITTQNGVHSAFKRIIDDCYGGHQMINVQYLDSTSGLKWLFEYVNNNIATNDLLFKRLWRVYHFSRSNFSPLHVNMMR